MQKPLGLNCNVTNIFRFPAYSFELMDCKSSNYDNCEKLEKETGYNQEFAQAIECYRYFYFCLFFM